MIRIILTLGIVAGVIAISPTIVIMSLMDGHPPMSWGMAIGYLSMLVAFSTIFVAIKRRRDAAPGRVIRFWPALGIGLGISVVASLTYVLGWEASQAIGGGDFAKTFADAMIAQERAKGVSGAALAKYAADMEQFRRDYADPSFRLPMTFVEIFPVGLLVSVVSAGLLSNRRFLAVRG